LPVQEIDTGLVMKVLEPIWSTKPETASRLRGRIEAVLSLATVRGYRTGDNPARWRGHLDQLLPATGKVRKVKHHAALDYAALPAFMDALRQRNSIATRALEFLILTGVRTGDIIGNDREDAPPMMWSHVDLGARVWTIPKTKTGAEHKVPLSGAAVAVLAEMKALGLGKIVFPSIDRPGHPLSNGAMLAVLKRMGRGDLTAHGFRATFKTWASERTTFPREVVEAALAHAISDKLEAAYRRGDFFEKRRRLMGAWAEYAGSTPAAGAVIPIGGRR
jgi:integrase